MTTPPASRPPLVLAGATVIDGDGRPQPDMAVVIEGERITQVDRSAQVAAPAGARAQRLAGGYLIAGLIDAHAHAEQDWALAAMLGLGVTSLRNPARTVAADAAQAPAVQQPRPAVVAAGFAIDAPGTTALGAVEVRDEEAMRREVSRQVAAGAELIKLYTGLGPQLLRAGVQRAHELGVKAMGDLAATSWTEAARAGIDCLAHAAPRHHSLLPPAVRSAYQQDVAERRVHPIWRWYELVDLDGAEVRQLVDTLAEHSVAVDPTLVTLEAMRFAGDPSYRRELDATRMWLPAASPLRDAMSAEASTPSPKRDADPLWRKVLGLVQRLHRGGVRLLAGTDTPRPWVVPGFSLHRELALLVSAGMTSGQALAAATSHNAAALGIADRAGAIAPGRAADLVLLEADPLATIANTLTIRWVMRAGVRCQPAELRAQYP